MGGPPGFPGPPPGYGMPPPGMMGMMPPGFPPRPMGMPPGMMGPPGHMMMGPGGPGVPGRIMTPQAPGGGGMIAGVKRAAAAAAAAERVGQSPTEKSTMVSVGKIAPSIDSKTIQVLLEACGPLKSWKRAEDPETKALKGFGFAEYEDAEGVLRAVRLLNALKVDGQELVIKGNSATQRYVEEHEINKKRDRQRNAAARAEAAKKKQAEEGEVVEEGSAGDAAASGVDVEEQEADNKALEIIMGIVSEREEEAAKRAGPGPQSTSSAAAAASASEFLAQVARGELRLPPPPAREEPPEPLGSSDRGRGKDRDRERDRDKDRDKDRDRERDRERDAEREKRRDADREFDAKLRELERMEKQRHDLIQREKQRLDQAEKDRLRQCRADLEVPDEDEDLPPWARRPYRGSRRCMERKRRRVMEEESDALDRQREQRELEAAMAERKRRRLSADDEDEQSEAVGGGSGRPLQHHGSALKHLKEEVGEAKAEPSEASAAPRNLSPDVDEADPIYRAMMAAATSAPRASASAAGGRSGAAAAAGSSGLPRPGDRALHHATHDPHAAIKSEHRNVMRSESPPPSAASSAPPPLAAAAPTRPPMGSGAAGAAALGGGPGRKRVVLKSVFGDEDEDGANKRVLKPIRYSEDEMKVADEIRSAALAEAASASQQQQQAATADTKAQIRALMDTIPTTKEAVWAYPIKWTQVNDAMKQRFSQWVDAKVAQLLGAPEPSVVSFILDLITQNKGPAPAAFELEALLDSDTETFVIKLYRTVIFETERAAAGF